MALLPMDEWRTAEALAAIPFVNPFLEERVKLERTALGSQIPRGRPGHDVKTGSDRGRDVPRIAGASGTVRANVCQAPRAA